MIKHYQFGFMHVVLNTTNGHMRFFEKEHHNNYLYEEFLGKDTRFFEPIDRINYTSRMYEKVTLSLNLTTKCNFNCKYCFQNHKNGKDFNGDYKKIIEDFVLENLDKRKIFVDLSGSGEPLIKLNLILDISKYCKKLSKKYKVDIIIQFVTNGYLLNNKVVKLLQENSILFGVSLDGNEENHNKNRLSEVGINTYNVVIKNLAAIEEKRFVGTAMVLDGSFNSNLLDCYLNMLKYSTTVSIKMKRDETGGEFKDNYKYLINNFFKVFLYLAEKAKKNDFNLLFSIINGDDFLGMFISRVFINGIVFARCDANIARKSYDIEGNLFPCAPSTIYEEFKITDDKKIISKLLKNDECSSCVCNLYCGGECPIVKWKLGRIDNYLCEIKRKVFEYSLWFKAYCLKYNEEGHERIKKYIHDKNKL